MGNTYKMETSHFMSNLSSHFSNASTGSLKLQQLDYNVYKVLSAQRFGNTSNVSYNADAKDKLCGPVYKGAYQICNTAQ